MKHTLKDKALSCIKDMILAGNPRLYPDEKVAPFRRLFKELTIIDDINVCRNRIISPEKLCPRLIKIAYESHQGLICTHQLLHHSIWFPG